MMASPQIAIVIPTYRQPYHLRRVLASVAAQQGVDLQRMEVVVADDGSADGTLEAIERYARSAPFPLRFTTHPHDSFQAARCRNEGVRATTAEYLLFLDGDCLIPPDHVAEHLRRRAPGTVMAGYCCRLDEPTTRRITEATVRSAEYLAWVSRSERRVLARMDRKSRFYNLIRHPTKPRMLSGNVGLWRADYERVNGFDERFRGWGGEDDDLRLRLRRAGVRIQSILRWTRTYHLWHAPDVTAPKRLRDGANIAYLHRPIRLTRCASGLVQRPPEDLDVRLVGTPSCPDRLVNLFPPRTAQRPAGSKTPAEVELLVVPGSDRFTGRADCNILLALEGAAVTARMARKAHLVLSDRPCPGVDPARRFGLHEFDQALEVILGARLLASEQRPDMEQAA